MSTGRTPSAWWTELTTVALIGTARRSVPDPPPGWGLTAGVTPEVAVLDGLAVGGARRRLRAAEPAEGGASAADEAAEEAAPETVPIPPAAARQLLELTLVQSPVGRALQPLLLRAWLVEAGRHGVRVPHPTLPTLLAAATVRGDLREPLRAVLGARGAWLAARNAAWSWAVPDNGGTEAEDVAAVTDDAWRTAPAGERERALRVVRSNNPPRGRELLAITWADDPAAQRAALLAVLAVGLGQADEPFLDSALDDRAGGVRDVARGLLDALPGSRRAARLAATLAPLITTTRATGAGRLRGRRVVAVELPDAPDAGARRDGVGPPPRGRSARGHALERLCAGAPLSLWTDATGLDPGGVLASLDSAHAADVLAGLRRAAAVRRDVAWAAALTAHSDVWHAELVALLDPADRERAALARLRRVPTVGDVIGVVAALPGPWSRELSRALVARLGELARSPHAVADHVVVLAERLHPSLGPDLRSLAASASDPLHHVGQYLVLVPQLREAFA